MRHKRLVALLTAVFFTLNHFSGYAGSIQVEGGKSKVEGSLLSLQPSTVNLPPELGKIEDAFQGTSDQTVVIVQDAHAIPDAQNNIQKIITHFSKQYGVRNVGLEGASARLDPQIFQSFPDKERLQKVFQEYLEQGELTAGTGAAIFSENPDTVFHGVEDWALYEQGLGLYLAAMEKESEFLKEVEGGRLKVEAEKAKTYSKELLSIDQKLQAFHRNQFDLPDIFEALAAIRKPEPGSELAAFAAEMKTQNKAEDELEVKRIAQRMKQSLDNPAFNEKYQQFQTSQISVQEFALFLKEFVPAVSFSKRLTRLVNQHKTVRDIEGTKFFGDFEHYAQSVKESLMQNEAQRRLDAESQELALTKKLVKLELSREEWEGLKGRMGEWGNGRGYEIHNAFYQNAEQRDQAFLKNLNKVFSLSPSRPSSHSTLLIAGGFHAQGLTERLKAQNISYLLVMPKITHIPAKKHYREHMKGEVSWKHYFEVRGGKINLYDAFVRGARDQLLQVEDGRSKVEVRVAKQWRDQIIRDLAKKKKIEKAGNYTKFIDEINSSSFHLPPSTLNRALKKLDHFLAGLRKLDAQKQLTEPNIINLLKPAAAVEVVLSSALDSSAKIFPFDDMPAQFRAEARFEFKDVEGFFEHENRFPPRRRAPSDQYTHRREILHNPDLIATVILESHHDPKSIQYLKSALESWEGKELTQENTLFIIEGARIRNALSSREPFRNAYDLSLNIAEHLNFKTPENLILNASLWPVIEQTIREASIKFPEVSREEVLGAIVFTAAQSRRDISQNDVVGAIEELYPAWRHATTYEELYHAAIEAIDRMESLRPKFAAFEANVVIENIEDWENVETLIEKARAYQLTRQDLLGILITQLGYQRVQEGYSTDVERLRNGQLLPVIHSFAEQVLQVLETGWDEGTNLEELHRAVYQSIEKFIENPESYFLYQQQIMELVTKVEDQMTAEAIQKYLDANPLIKQVLVITGYNHEQGVVPILENYRRSETRLNVPFAWIPKDIPNDWGNKEEFVHMDFEIQNHGLGEGPLKGSLNRREDHWNLFLEASGSKSAQYNLNKKEGGSFVEDILRALFKNESAKQIVLRDRWKTFRPLLPVDVQEDLKQTPRITLTPKQKRIRLKKIAERVWYEGLNSPERLVILESIGTLSLEETELSKKIGDLLEKFAGWPTLKVKEFFEISDHLEAIALSEKERRESFLKKPQEILAMDVMTSRGEEYGAQIRVVMQLKNNQNLAIAIISGRDPSPGFVHAFNPNATLEKPIPLPFNFIATFSEKIALFPEAENQVLELLSEHADSWKHLSSKMPENWQKAIQEGLGKKGNSSQGEGQFGNRSEARSTLKVIVQQLMEATLIARVKIEARQSDDLGAVLGQLAQALAQIALNPSSVFEVVESLPEEAKEYFELVPSQYLIRSVKELAEDIFLQLKDIYVGPEVLGIEIASIHHSYEHPINNSGYQINLEEGYTTESIQRNLEDQMNKRYLPEQLKGAVFTRVFTYNLDMGYDTILYHMLPGPSSSVRPESRQSKSENGDSPQQPNPYQAPESSETVRSDWKESAGILAIGLLMTIVLEVLPSMKLENEAWRSIVLSRSLMKLPVMIFAAFLLVRTLADFLLTRWKDITGIVILSFLISFGLLLDRIVLDIWGMQIQQILPAQFNQPLFPGISVLSALISGIGLIGLISLHLVLNYIKKPKDIPSDDQDSPRSEVRHMPSPLSDSDKKLLRDMIEKEMSFIKSAEGKNFNVFMIDNPLSPLKGYVLKVPKQNDSHMETAVQVAKETMGGLIAPFTILHDVTVQGVNYQTAVIQKRLKTLSYEEFSNLRTETADLIHEMVRRNIVPYDALIERNFGVDEESGQLLFVDDMDAARGSLDRMFPKMTSPGYYPRGKGVMVEGITREFEKGWSGSVLSEIKSDEELYQMWKNERHAEIPVDDVRLPPPEVRNEKGDSPQEEGQAEGRSESREKDEKFVSQRSEMRTARSVLKTDLAADHYLASRWGSAATLREKWKAAESLIEGNKEHQVFFKMVVAGLYFEERYQIVDIQYVEDQSSARLDWNVKEAELALQRMEELDAVLTKHERLAKIIRFLNSKKRNNLKIYFVRNYNHFTHSRRSDFDAAHRNNMVTLPLYAEDTAISGMEILGGEGSKVENRSFHYMERLVSHELAHMFFDKDNYFKFTSLPQSFHLAFVNSYILRLQAVTQSALKAGRNQMIAEDSAKGFLTPFSQSSLIEFLAESLSLQWLDPEWFADSDPSMAPLLDSLMNWSKSVFSVRSEARVTGRTPDTELGTRRPARAEARGDFLNPVRRFDVAHLKQTKIDRLIVALRILFATMFFVGAGMLTIGLMVQHKKEMQKNVEQKERLSQVSKHRTESRKWKWDSKITNSMRSILQPKIEEMASDDIREIFVVLNAAPVIKQRGATVTLTLAEPLFQTALQASGDQALQPLIDQIQRLQKSLTLPPLDESVHILSSAHEDEKEAEWVIERIKEIVAALDDPARPIVLWSENVPAPFEIDEVQAEYDEARVPIDLKKELLKEVTDKKVVQMLRYYYQKYSDSVEFAKEVGAIGIFATKISEYIETLRESGIIITRRYEKPSFEAYLLILKAKAALKEMGDSLIKGDGERAILFLARNYSFLEQSKELRDSDYAQVIAQTVPEKPFALNIITRGAAHEVPLTKSLEAKGVKSRRTTFWKSQNVVRASADYMKENESLESRRGRRLLIEELFNVAIVGFLQSKDVEEDPIKVLETTLENWSEEFYDAWLKEVASSPSLSYRDLGRKTWDWLKQRPEIAASNFAPAYTQINQRVEARPEMRNETKKLTDWGSLLESAGEKIAEDRILNRSEALAVKEMYEEQGDQALYHQLKDTIVNYYAEMKTEPGIDHYIVEASEQTDLAILDLVRSEVDNATAEQKIVIGFALTQGTGDPFRKALFEILKTVQDVGTVVFDGKIDAEFSRGMKELGINLQPVNGTVKAPAVLDQAGVPIALSPGYEASKINKAYIPFRIDLGEYATEPLAQDNAHKIEMVAQILTARLVAADATLRDDHERLKGKLIEELGKVAALKEVVTLSNGHFVINGAAAWLAVLDLALKARTATERAA